MYAYNCTKYSVTGYSPYYLLFDRKPRLPVDFILKGQQEIEKEDQDYNTYSKMWKERMNKAYKIANQNTTGRRQQDKARKDIKSTLPVSEKWEAKVILGTESIHNRGG